FARTRRHGSVAVREWSADGRAGSSQRVDGADGTVVTASARWLGDAIAQSTVVAGPAGGPLGGGGAAFFVIDPHGTDQPFHHADGKLIVKSDGEGNQTVIHQWTWPDGTVETEIWTEDSAGNAHVENWETEPGTLEPEDEYPYDEPDSTDDDTYDDED